MDMEMEQIWEIQKKDSILDDFQATKGWFEYKTNQWADWKNGGSISTPLEFGVLMSFTFFKLY